MKEVSFHNIKELTRSYAQHVMSVMSDKERFSDGYDYDSFNEVYIGKSESEELYVAFFDDEPIGYVLLELFEGSFHVNDILFMEKFRGKGYAKDLLNFAINSTIDGVEGYYYVSLEVDVKNKGAIIFYIKFGFVPSGFMAGYYLNTDNGTASDALIMKYKLSKE